MHAPFLSRAHPENAFTFSRNLLMPPKFYTHVQSRVSRKYECICIHTDVYVRSIHFIKYVTSRIFASLSSTAHVAYTYRRPQPQFYLSGPGSLKIKVNPPRLHWTCASPYAPIVFLIIDNIRRHFI